MKEINVVITFTEELLGTAASDPTIHGTWVGSLAPDAKSKEEEVAALGVDEVVEKSMSIFPKRNGNPFLWDYQLKGFFKDACGMLARVTGTKSSKTKAYKKVIDGLVFVKQREVPLVLPPNTKIGSCQRPLRAQTAQGERVALANSETVPVGTTLTFTVTLFEDNLEGILKEWLNYGQFRGIGQWRNSGKGRFTWVEIPAAA